MFMRYIFLEYEHEYINVLLEVVACRGKILLRTITTTFNQPVTNKKINSHFYMIYIITITKENTHSPMVYCNSYGM